MRRLRRAIPHLTVAVWMALVAAGFLLLIDYGLKAGSPAAAPSRWPEEASFARSESTPTLVLIAHPHCPCTRASLRELELILTRRQGLLKAYVLFIRPDGVAADWTDTDLWRDAGAIPGVTPLLDDGLVQAARFGATTSGQVLLYDADGRLLFSGGITPSRGEPGVNAGRQTILSLLQGQPGAAGTTPVYGCALRDPSQTSRM